MRTHYFSENLVNFSAGFLLCVSFIRKFAASIAVFVTKDACFQHEIKSLSAGRRYDLIGKLMYQLSEEVLATKSWKNFRNEPWRKLGTP